MYLFCLYLFCLNLFVNIAIIVVVIVCLYLFENINIAGIVNFIEGCLVAHIGKKKTPTQKNMLLTGEELTICYADTNLPTNVRSSTIGLF